LHNGNINLEYVNFVGLYSIIVLYNCITIHGAEKHKKEPLIIIRP